MGTLRRLYVQSSGLQQLNYQKAAQDQSAIGSCKKWVSTLRGHNGRVEDYHRNSRRLYYKQTLTRFCTKCALFQGTDATAKDGSTTSEMRLSKSLAVMCWTLLWATERDRYLSDTAEKKHDWRRYFAESKGEKFNQDKFRPCYMSPITSTTTTHNTASIFILSSRDDTQVWVDVSVI